MEIEKKCLDTLEKLYKFSEDILQLGEPIGDERLENFEKSLGYKLPEDFKFIIKKHNGIILAGTEIFGLSADLREGSIDKVYAFEHFETENEMPEFFLPFSPDGQGNHYCFDLSKLQDGICPVVFWQWDFEYESSDDVEICNEDFTDWISEVMIDWTLKTFNYDGSEK